MDGTRGVRENVAPVWVFDPQKIAQEEPDWWWNPLSYVTDEEKAYKLTQHFSVGSRVPGSKPDAYFDPKAEDILSSYFLAAALGDLPITQVYLWVTEQVSQEPIEILREHDYELQYKGLESTLKLADKQRDGIFGTAEKMIQCLKSRNTLRWVAPTGGANVASDTRRQFNPHAFATSQETIYILSKEGAGSAAPLTTALTVAIAEAMEERTERSGGRLPKPALFALDELANVVRWAGLPDQFSHYGSKGLIVMGILQSWSQGVELWGEANMRKIWSAANVKVYGGGVAEEGFLRALSDLIGDYSYINISVSSGKSGPAAPGRKPRNASSTSPTWPNWTAAARSSWLRERRPPWSGPCPGTQDHTRMLWKLPSRHTAPGPRKRRCRWRPHLSLIPGSRSKEAAAMTDDFGLFDTDTPPASAGGSEDERAEKAPELVYGSAEEFLHEQLLPTYVRSVTGKSAKWCIEWYFHPEAVSRVAALGRSWEHLRLDPATGMSVWWRDHADHHMKVLLDPHGPFHNCDMKEHRDPEHLEPKGTRRLVPRRAGYSCIMVCCGTMYFHE